MATTFPKTKLTYFNIEGLAEQIRLTFALAGIPFQDERIPFEKWPEIKPTTPFGQVPMIEVEGLGKVAQSGAILRWIGRLTGLYPVEPTDQLFVDEVLGLLDDVAKGLFPVYYITKAPEKFGHPKDLSEPEKLAIQEKLQASLLADDLPRLMGYFNSMLARNKAFPFFFKKTPTIADVSFFTLIRRLRSLSWIPPSFFDNCPYIKEFELAFGQLPQIATHYERRGTPAIMTLPSREMTLYGFPVSQPTRSCLYFASIVKSVKINFTAVNILAGEHKKPPYDTLLPTGKVPYLKDNKSAFGIFEGAAILLFLAASDASSGQPGGQWIPWPPGSNLQTMAQMHQWMHWHHTNARKSTSEILLPKLFKQDFSKALDEFKAGPLAFLEAHLSKNSFLTGSKPTVADLFLLPEIDQLEILGLVNFSQDAPSIGRWVTALTAKIPVYSDHIAVVRSMLGV